ncbi:uncharacterized protein LOC129598245 [Paramacrobiotus metropolitanus]|uniref:uncharacterized protein LOC129598245 n=1 Tax=Paramacrobiotus metropolitanus TaxID=2943436 RepID=UPI0024458C04|nr:uncharacterized protein LOC129598245 [Paramacrobiotus metropolitanus]
MFSLSFFQLFLVTIMISVSFCFYAIQRSLKNAVEKDNIKLVRSVMSDHTAVGDAVSELDNILCFPSPILFIYFLLCILVGISVFTGGIGEPGAIEVFGVATATVIVMTTCFVTVTNQAEAVVPVLLKFLRTVDDCKEHYRLSFYITSLQTNRVGFTFGKFFTIDRTFVISLTGALITYALIMWELGDKGESMESLSDCAVLWKKCGNFSFGST